MNLIDKIQKNIEEKHISPKSKWNFVFKEGILWFFGGASVLVGGIFVAASLFVIRNAHWSNYQLTHENSFSEFFLEVVPFIWLILFSVFVFITYKFFRHTKKGYRYNFVFVVLGVFAASLVFGWVAFTTGIGYMVENGLDRKVSIYKGVESREMMSWSNSSKGLFVGHLFMQDDRLFLKSQDGKVIEVDTVDIKDGLKYFSEENDDIFRIIGVTTDNESIYPCAIIPFEIEKNRLFGGNVIKIENEINLTENRINHCNGLKPYAKLKLINQ